MQLRVRRALATLTVATLGVAVFAALPVTAGATDGPVGSNPVTEKDLDSLLQRLDVLEEAASQAQAGETGGSTEDFQADPIDELVAMVPQAVYDEYPGYDGLIRGTANPDDVIHTGASIPGCVAAGTRLLPGFPPPYGYYQPATTNNFCLPNDTNGGCSGVPDNGLTFDFRAACRQHDIAYHFAPTARSTVDGRFLTDMGSDCARRGGWRIWQQPYCYERAALYYLGVRLFGGLVYGNASRPGYNEPLPPGGFEPPPAPTTCLQPSHGTLYYPPGGANIPRGATIYLAGVVHQHSRIRFEFRNSSGTLLATHLTYFSEENCVVLYESERFNTSYLPVGPVAVSATFARWEASDEVTQQLGTYNITTGGGTTTCLQYTHAWVHPGGTIVQGQTVYPTGVVKRYTSVWFAFYDGGGTLVATHLTRPAGSNCVINYEPEAMSTWSFPVGTVTAVATYTEWESDQVVTVPVTTFQVVAGYPGGSGGGGDGGGGCGDVVCPEEPPVMAAA